MPLGRPTRLSSSSARPGRRFKATKIDRRKLIDGRTAEEHSRWERLKQECKSRANWTCQAEGCGWHANPWQRWRLHAHHRVPRSKGGKDEIDNLICLCENCHTDHHPENRGMQRKRERRGYS